VIAARNPETLLLVGDFMQLPPVIVNQKVKDRIGTSLMERLWHNTVVPRRQLIYQYRFDRQFESFLNEFIYNAQSGMSPIVTDLDRPREVVRHGLSVDMPIVVIDSSSAPHKGGETHELRSGYENVSEAQLVVDVVRRFAESSHMVNSVSPASMGICTPYKRQAALIRYKLQRMVKPGGFKYNLVTVATADAFQGSERDYMIISTVRTSVKGIQFALSQKRLNVMLTRGKVLTVVISNKAMFESKDMQLFLRRDKISRDACQGGVAFQGLFKWAITNGVVYNFSNWATIFQTNSVVSNVVEINGQPESAGIVHSVNRISLSDVSDTISQRIPQILCSRLSNGTHKDLGWEVQCQSRTRVTIVRVLTEGWTQEWAHVPVQLRVIFNGTHEPTQIDGVTSVKRIDVNQIDGQLGVTNSSQVALMAHAYRCAISNADTEGMHMIMVSLFPYQTHAQLVREYTHSCLEAIVDEVRNSQFLHEIYVFTTSKVKWRSG